MQCPACKSASPDDVRFCLHCGQFFGEPNDTTLVRPQKRVPPATTVAANSTLFADYQPSHFESDYERPRKRQWPLVVALAMLAAIVLMVIGGVIAVALIQNAGGVAVDLPNNQRLTVLTTPTPIGNNAAEEKSLPTPTPGASLRERVLLPLAQPHEIRAFTFSHVPFVVQSPNGENIVGWFRAEPASLEVLVLNENSYIEFVRTNEASSWAYRSGMVSGVTFDVWLQRGSYHLVFHNTSGSQTSLTGNIVLRGK